MVVSDLVLLACIVIIDRFFALSSPGEVPREEWIALFVVYMVARSLLVWKIS